jgi:pyruvate/2-oxoglutarate dehydrogenase complex dihydrolipoamide acyltransferase (E2) component
MSILIKTFCLALREYPRMNSTYSLQDPFTYKIHPQYHILLPAFSDKGTIFNVLNNAESLNIKQISTALTHPTPQSLSSATICVSNIGALNTLAMNPLIYGEISTHASVGSLRKIPMLISGKTH